MARQTKAAAAAALTPAPKSIYESSDDEAAPGARWDEVDGDVLRAAAEAVSRLGHALMLGRTSDGGALSVTILAGAARTKKYFDDSRNAQEWLRHVTAIALDGYMSMAK